MSDQVAPPEPVLQVRDLRVGFGRDGSVTEVVHGIGFELQRGRVLALVGESGSGKSVSAMSLLGLLPGTARVSGSARLDGVEILGADAAQLRVLRGGRIATIFQEPASALNPVFTVGAQIAEAIWAHHPDQPRAERAARVLELLGLVQVDDPRRVAAAYPHELSGGQLQRAMIAMALSNDPAVLIADEPTTALDVTVQAGVLALLRDLARRLDAAVLLITHDMGVVADLADQVAVLRDGDIVESAPVRDLFARPVHDYTRRLLAAVPVLDSAVAEPTIAPPDDTDVATAAELVDGVVVFTGRGLGAGLTAVDHVTLRIGHGELVGLVGESGSGKSTVGRVLSGLVPLRSGTARLDGVDLAHVRPADLRRVRSRLGLVFQDPASSLNPRHTVEQSVIAPVLLHERLSPAQRRVRVTELLSAVRLSRGLVDAYPHELSGGQRQRVAIARALATRPALLIADEPTSALDVSVQDQVLGLLRELQTELDFACLFISHDLAVVSELTSRVAVMHQGRIVEQGPTRQVLTAPTDSYTTRLLAAVPVADPDRQAERRTAWEQLTA